MVCFVLLDFTGQEQSALDEDMPPTAIVYKSYLKIINSEEGNWSEQEFIHMLLVTLILESSFSRAA